MVERVARRMREAFGRYDNGSPTVPWEDAKPDRREAWMVCARAGIAEHDAALAEAGRGS